MNRYLKGFLLINLLIASGCAVKQAQNAQEFRQMIPHDSYGHQETTLINAPYAQVLKRFKKKTDPCLKTEVVMTSTNQYGQTLNTMYLSYTPILTENGAKSELTVQLNISGGGMIAGKVPDKGMYILVADVTAAGKSKSNLTVYRNSFYGAGRIEASLKDWASGANLECPDMSS